MAGLASSLFASWARPRKPCDIGANLRSPALGRQPHSISCVGSGTGDGVREFAPGRTVSADELVEHCGAHIAGYKKPKHVSFVDALPRNTTGKVMKGPLREQARRERPELFGKDESRLGV